MEICRQRFIEDEVLEALERRKKQFLTENAPLDHQIEFDCLKAEAEGKELPDKRRVQTLCLRNAENFELLRGTTHGGLISMTEITFKRLGQYQKNRLRKFVTALADSERLECRKKLDRALECENMCLLEQSAEMYEKYENELLIYKRKVEEYYKKKCDKQIKQIVIDCNKTVACVLKLREQSHNLCDPCKDMKADKGVPSATDITETDDKMTDTDDLLPPINFDKNHAFFNKNLCSILHFILRARKLKSFTDESVLKSEDNKVLCKIKALIDEINYNVTDLVNFDDSIKTESINSSESSTQPQERISVLERPVRKARWKINEVSEIVDNLIATLISKKPKKEPKIIEKVKCALIIPVDEMEDKFCDCYSSSLKSSTTSVFESSDEDILCTCGCIEVLLTSDNMPLTLWNEDDKTPIPKKCTCGEKCVCNLEQDEKKYLIKKLFELVNQRDDLCHIKKSKNKDEPKNYFNHPLSDDELKELVKTLKSSTSAILTNN